MSGRWSLTDLPEWGRQPDRRMSLNDTILGSVIRVIGSKKTGVVVLLREESWSTGGHPYYDGIRLTADGSRVAEDQPSLRPMMGKVLTESGW